MFDTRSAVSYLDATRGAGDRDNSESSTPLAAAAVEFWWTNGPRSDEEPELEEPTITQSSAANASNHRQRRPHKLLARRQ